MAVYSPESLGIKPDAGGFKQGGWYQGRQYWGGTLSDPGTIHPSSDQIGAGQRVSAEVNAQSAAQQGVTPQNFENYLQQQRQQSASVRPASTPFSGMPSAPGGDGSGAGFQAPQAIDLESIYRGLFDSSGIKDIEIDLSGKAKAYADQLAKIKDNPYLSEATMTGRIKKIDEKFSADSRNLQNDIATRKADIETQLNLKLKQFDINSQQAQQALSQFNTLLAAGALDNADGNDIANITRSTGLSSNMIYSAIKANQAKNVQTSTISFDDGSNQGFAIINSQTGEIISKQNIASSKPKAAEKASESEQKAYYLNSLRGDASSGKLTVPDIFRIYSGYVDPNQILSIYNTSSPYGPATEDPNLLASYGVKY